MPAVKKILIAPDKFKGTLTASQAARAIERGLLSQHPGLGIRLLPIADGGEGTTDAIRAALPRCTPLDIPTINPLGETCAAAVALADDTAFFEMAAASGLKFVPPEKRDPWRVNTLGTGLVLRALLERGIRKINIGLGGSATNDAGAGMAAALGFRFLDKHGNEITPIPANFPDIAKIAPPGARMADALRNAQITALCDVANPLLGPDGASFVYGPQKGLLDPARIDAALAGFADLVARDLGADHRATPGAGAAGGLGYGLLTFCGARLAPGFQVIADMAGIHDAVREADLVITGEGRLDRQTLFGKGPAELAQLARQAGKPIAAFCGCVEAGAEPQLREVFVAIIPLTGPRANGDGAGAALETAASDFAKSALF